MQETIVINGMEYIRKDSVAKFAPEVEGTINHGIQIVVLDKGFIYVGKVKTDKDWCYIENASCIRYWGTTKGLGELVDGPLSGTKLDKIGMVRANIKSLIHLIAIKESAWTTKL